MQSNNFRKESKKQSSKRFNWGCIVPFLFWGGIIFYFFIFPMFNNDNSSSNKTTTSTPPYSSSKPSTSTSSYNSSKTSNLQNGLSQLKIRIENLAEIIKKKETRILEFESWFKSEKDKLEALESEIKWLELGIENTIVGKDKLINEYNQKIEQYDNLVNSYNKVYLEYEKLFDEYEKDIITYDSLVESYNAGVIPPMIQNQLSEDVVSDNIYFIEVGDSLWKIAEKFGTTVEKIVARNELADSRLIRPGQKLIIPTE